MSERYRYLRWLADCADVGTVELVGGKAVGLARLWQLELPVPFGFAVTLDAYRDFLADSGLEEAIHSYLAKAKTVDEQREASELIGKLFSDAPLDHALAEEISDAYARLSPDGQMPVAVRSSANAEDTADASFAGQQETYLWVRGAESIVSHVIRCWSSLFSPQAISYRAHLDEPWANRLGMGVVVQEMVPATAAGVMITIDPVTGDPSQISIEACHGLGVGVVSGEVTPDRFYVDKVTGEIRSRTINPKVEEFRFDPEHGEVRKLPVPEDRQSEPSLVNDEVQAIAEMGKHIERSLGGPQDVEWALGQGEPGERELFMLQTRPETVWARKGRKPITDPGSTVMDRLLKTISTPIKLKES